jgi:hypothetical protein
MKSHSQIAASFGRNLALQYISEGLYWPDKTHMVSRPVTAMASALTMDPIKHRELREEAIAEFQRAMDIHQESLAASRSK